MSAIEFDNVSFGWTNREILKNITFSVAENEVFALLGPSGCGKTTALRLISGLLSPSTGRVLIYGKDARSYRGTDRCVATVWQSRALFPHMSVRKNIEFGLRVQSIEESERRHRVEAVVKALRLESALDRGIGGLSGGEQQRVALARSLVIRPKILLLDEPYTGLDQNLKLQLQGDLRDLRASYGYTYILVSHSLDDVFSLADRLAVVNEGRIVQIDTPNEVFQNPSTPMVAKFVGQRNLIPGTVVGIHPNKQMASVHTGVGSPWIGTNKDLVNLNEKVFYVISPEDIKLDGTEELKVATTFRAKEIAGRREMYYLRLLNGHEIRVNSYSVDGRSGPNFAPGQLVEVSWSQGSAFILRTDQ